MPRTCTICSRGDRATIEHAMVSGQSLRSIANRYGTSAPTLLRHKPHMVKLIDAAVAKRSAADAARAEDQVEFLYNLRMHAMTLLKKVESTGDFRAAIAAVREIVHCMETSGKFLQMERFESAGSAIIDPSALTDEQLTRIIMSDPSAREILAQPAPGAAPPLARVVPVADDDGDGDADAV